MIGRQRQCAVIERKRLLEPLEAGLERPEIDQSRDKVRLELERAIEASFRRGDLALGAAQEAEGMPDFGAAAVGRERLAEGRLRLREGPPLALELRELDQGLGAARSLRGRH